LLLGKGGRRQAATACQTEAMQAPVSAASRRSAIARETDALLGELIAIRRDIHAHPEIGHEEYRTTGLIVDLLERSGLVGKVLPIGTGAFCDVLPPGFDYADGLVGLRADIDALPISDRTAAPFASVHPGICHACGHDVHTAILIGVGMVLSRLREQGQLVRGVRLIFQPAEEMSPGGAVDAIEGGVLTDVSEVYALHCDPRTEVGRLAFKVGPITAAVDRVKVSLTGAGGHTSRPHLTADLVGALGALATSMQLLLSRRVDPRSGVSLVWGRINAGTAANAIPETGTIEGTLRSLDNRGWQLAKQLTPELAEEIVAPFQVGIKVSVTDGVPPAVNHSAGVRRMIHATTEMLGSSAVTGTEQSLGGEDFSWMLLQRPGALARLGVRPSGTATCPDLHHPNFTVDEGCIPIGLKVLAELATTRASVGERLTT
jgi:amidohydrolase